MLTHCTPQPELAQHPYHVLVHGFVDPLYHTGLIRYAPYRMVRFLWQLEFVNEVAPLITREGYIITTYIICNLYQFYESY